MRKFEEELQIAFEAGMKTYSGNTAWNFVNGVIYSLTVVSTNDFFRRFAQGGDAHYGQRVAVMTESLFVC